MQFTPLDEGLNPICQIATGSKLANYKIKTAHLDHLFFPFGPYVICGDDPILAGKVSMPPDVIVCETRSDTRKDIDRGNRILQSSWKRPRCWV